MKKQLIIAMLTLVAMTGLAQEKEKKQTEENSYRFSRKPKKKRKVNSEK